MSVAVKRGVSEARWSTGAVSLAGASLSATVRAVPDGAAVPLSASLDPSDPTVLVVQVGALALGEYQLELRAERGGQVAYFPSADFETFYVVEHL